MKTINVSIEKISNGFVITIDGKKTFCDVPEAICGELAQWALKTCENLKELKSKKSAVDELYEYQKLMAQLEQAQKQAQINPPWATVTGTAAPIGQPTWTSTCTATGTAR